jgi:uncharacterized protein (TIGR01777 family)
MAGLKVLVSGAGGFIGTPLSEKLRERGDTVVALTRGASGEGRIHWDPSSGELDREELAGFDAVVHLAGESLAGLWTSKKKQTIIDSRREGTRLLTEAVAELVPKPKVFVSSGAIGFYGSRGDEVLSENSGSGDGFLSEVVGEWEAAAQPARDAGIRTVNLRLGLVLDPSGGMLGVIRPIFRLGGGGKLGSGDQWWSWVTLDDVIRAFLFAIDNETTEGPYNVAAPNPVTNAAFTKALGKQLHRPTVLPAPAFAMKAVLRDMADEMMLASQRVDTGRLEAAGFRYLDPDLKPALRRIL